MNTVDREYSIISMQYDEAKDQLKKKSATITDKSNTIRIFKHKEYGIDGGFYKAISEDSRIGI